NNRCISCGHQLGFLPGAMDLSALDPASDGTFLPLNQSAAGQLHRRCHNEPAPDLCNWLVPVEDPEPLCVVCRLNEVIPDLSIAANHDRWHRLACAERRLLYTLLRLRLSLDTTATKDRPALRFRFLSDEGTATKVLTGHAAGVITFNIVEADDAVREQRRISMHEPMRTLLGHFRHEIGHYYWDRLIANSPWQERFRERFGNERDDYPAALKRHYDHGPAADWQERHVSAYASVHPWEDWAESW